MPILLHYNSEFDTMIAEGSKFSEMYYNNEKLFRYRIYAGVGHCEYMSCRNKKFY